LRGKQEAGQLKDITERRACRGHRVSGRQEGLKKTDLWNPGPQRRVGVETLLRGRGAQGKQRFFGLAKGRSPSSKMGTEKGLPGGNKKTRPRCLLGGRDNSQRTWRFFLGGAWGLGNCSRNRSTRGGGKAGDKRAGKKKGLFFTHTKMRGKGVLFNWGVVGSLLGQVTNR